MKKRTFEHKSLVESIVERIEEQILNATLQPGEWIREQSLCEELGVSRSPVRESLIILENQGFLVKEARKGVRVTKTTYKEAVDAYTIRANLESLATFLAVKKRKPGLAAELKALNQRLTKVCTDGNGKEYYRLNTRFHQTLVGACDNERLIRMLGIFNKQTARYRKEVLYQPGRMEESVKRHELLIKSVEDGNAKMAERIRKEAILANIEHLQHMFKDEEEGFEDQSRRMHIMP
ncbi:MAG: GntR family transcriptional regulator [Desulfobacterales bacterium]|nr:GntR family transcriptional regulator [Deltaproteobacteria bacterium]MBT8360833.1 GntR family transcriptional regulator [Deltaproteobacteria bacterium]NNK96385.1 GntR family transcriptional regulator [Desulfobacterales bacterium]